MLIFDRNGEAWDYNCDYEGWYQDEYGEWHQDPAYYQHYYEQYYAEQQSAQSTDQAKNTTTKKHQELKVRLRSLNLSCSVN